MNKPKFLCKVVLDDSGCWLWIGKRGKAGYGKIRVSGMNTEVLAHRVSYEMFNGPIPSDLCVLHRCDVPACVNPDHLFLGTRGDNRRDCVAKDRHAKRFPAMQGESHPNAKLSLESVAAIRKSGAGYGSLAKQYRVSKSLIAQIKTGRAWTNVEE